MAKVFTITEGLENLGALKSGGQGSVYKARKAGDIITAIKILPTPISSESEADKNFISFQNEVNKLKKVNEIPNPNVVSIIAAGITSTGNLPYIEMEYIEGPDLAELLHPPADPVFAIQETIKVAEQLANALAHCHRADVKHGDIKSNNVKFNQHTGNYMLLDFGLSVMSDEQRRTSIRYAGAIEFMAPEQSAGEMFFETDVYSFGIILFELLTGNVPFPLNNKGEMARNAVMVAHMETLPPDIISLRRQALPDSWSYDQKEREMQVPLWLHKLIYTCLEKDPGKRFKNGMELLHFIQSNIEAEEDKKRLKGLTISTAMLPTGDPTWEKEIQKLERKLAEKDELIGNLQYQVESKDRELYQYQYQQYNYLSKPKGVSKSLFSLILIIALGLASYAGYNIYIAPNKNLIADTTVQPLKKISGLTDSSDILINKPVKKVKGKLKKNSHNPVNSELPESISIPADAVGKKYRTTRIAYFHTLPDEKTKRNAYLTVNNKILTSLDERNDFIYIVYQNDEGKITKGWLLKKDLFLVNEL